MLTFETRNRLADLFLAISDGERQIEIVRQILCEQIDFEPYAAFKRIDRSRKGAIDSYDILRFLTDNKLQHTEEGCRSFIKRYDVDGDGQLVYNEFLSAVLPMDNPTLRTIAAQRPNYEVNENQLLAYDVEYSLSKVIDREIAFYASLDIPKASLQRCPDFNYLDAFAAINITSGKITFDKIESFFNKLALYPNEDELVALLRRLDRDDDGCLTYEEFVIGLQPHDHNLIANINRPDHTSMSKSRVYSPSRSLAHFERTSPNRSNLSLHRAVTPLRQDSSPYKKVASPRRILDSSLRRVASPTRRVGSPSRVISPSRVLSPEASMRIMNITRSSPFQESYIRPSYASIGQERVVSPVKFAGKESQFGFRSTASTLKVTERPTSPYRVTLKHASRVQSSPLKQSDLSVVHSRSPLRQQETMKRSINGETSGNRGLLKSSEKSILKKNGLYSSMSTSFYDKSQTMSIKNENRRGNKFERTEEKEGLIEVLKQFVKLEKELEAVKQDLAMRSDFNLLDFFRIFDVNERGAISSNEIREGFERFNVIPNKEQLYLFMRRFDRDNDGKLKFSDFAEAFTCKQQEYANLLNNRIPAKEEANLNVDQAFGESTRKTIARALRTHLDNEISIESLRQRLTRRYKFNTHEGFAFLDLREDGVLTSEEIGEVLDKNHCYATQKEVSLVIDRMDINRNGKVTYSEFVQEMTPKSDVTF